MKQNKTIFLDKITNFFEIGIAVFLLVVVAIKVVEIIGELFGVGLDILAMDFEGIMSVSLTLVVCVEFIKMLYRHNYETVIHVLLFAIAIRTSQQLRKNLILHYGVFPLPFAEALKCGTALLWQKTVWQKKQVFLLASVTVKRNKFAPTSGMLQRI